MKPQEISGLLAEQRAFFAKGTTLDVGYRQAQLNKLHGALIAMEKPILDALASDLRKPPFEGFLSEVYFTVEEAKYARKRLSKWARPRRVGTPPILWPARSELRYDPKGIVLILGPWNYPFQLMISPLVAAIAAGNCAILKPSEFAPATSQVIAKLIEDTFAREYVACVEGATEMATALLAEKFDHIFFTGGAAVGRIVMTAAAKHLTPVTLELGGKSPCIVDSDVNLKVAAKRIAWGKFFNAGQTCVAPDYLLVPEGHQGEIVAALRDSILEMFGENPAQSRDYGRIVNERHFHRLKNLLSAGRPVFGGDSRANELYIAPTVIEGMSDNDEVMREEIFGPILPIRTYRTREEALEFIKARSKPLALYVFSNDKAFQEKVLSEVSFGGGCVNDTIVHLQNPKLPFGGVGDSGMGAYHGEIGFQEMSHRKGVVRKPFFLDMKFRYPPYGERLNLLRKLLR